MMAAGSQILTTCLCRGESVKKSQNQDIQDKRMVRMKGEADGWGTDRWSLTKKGYVEMA